MIKSTNIKIWVLIVAVALAIASWMFIERLNQQKRQEAEESLDFGIALFKEKKYPEALQVFEKFPGGTPNEWRVRHYQGSTYIMLKDYQSAATYLEQALALNPTGTQIMHALGVAYFKLGNLKMSKAYYAAILEINPGDNEAKGLMDTMAKLETQQPDYVKPGSEQKIE
jgi:Flp pilus assembly protein TadD